VKAAFVEPPYEIADDYCARLLVAVVKGKMSVGKDSLDAGDVLVLGAPMQQEVKGTGLAVVASTPMAQPCVATARPAESRAIVRGKDTKKLTFAKGKMNAWLDDIAIAFAGQPLSLKQWIPILEAGLSSLSVGVIPPVLDEVLTANDRYAASFGEKAGLTLPVDLSAAPYRDIGTPLLAYIRELTEDPDTVVNIVMPEIVVRGWARFLHNQRALYIKRLLLFERHVILSSVPYQLFR